MAPEIIKDQQYDSKVDIWSIGIITCKLLLGKGPYGNVNLEQLVTIVKSKGLILDASFKEKFSEDCVDFIQKCVILHPKKRYTAKKLLKHPWILKNAQTNKNISD